MTTMQATRAEADEGLQLQESIEVLKVTDHPDAVTKLSLVKKTLRTCGDSISTRTIQRS
jgi:predicted Zn-ribbon and HTH transcriptional regulator